MISASDALQKWVQNASRSGEAIKAGVMGVTESPTAKAARAQDRYLSGIQDAVASGKWQRGLARVSLEDWRQAMLSKGVARHATGVVAAKDKMGNFLNEFLPYVANARSQLASTPRGTLEDNIQRMVNMTRMLSNFKRGSRM